MRRAGILLHPTSLPGPGPCGDLGQGARTFLDWLQAAGQGIWQVLPLVPPGGGFSPYDSPGAMALGTHLVSLEDLVTDGLLARAELADRPRFAAGKVDVAAVHAWHRPLVDLAARRFARADTGDLRRFADDHPWLQSWALYRALVEAHDTVAGWWDLPRPLRDRQPDALARASQQHQDAVDRHLAAQLLVHRQWHALRADANRRGILLVGDLPIFVSGAGSDTWVHRDHFLWGAPQKGRDAGRPRPDPVAGVPPDYFSPTGQRWGNPMYAWDRHAADGYAWWRTRFRAVLGLVDAVRVDHFRGFVDAWAVPADAPDATTGRWTPGPGRALFDAVAADLRADPPPGLDPAAPLPIIAEDLGIITDAVHDLRDALALPGMKILQFAFGGDSSHPFLPHSWTHERWVAYTGTHDNDTVVGWYQQTSDAVRDHFRRYLGRDGREPHWQLLRALYGSIARWAVAPLQDVLGLGAEARMNVPGEAEGNWCWRADDLPMSAAWRLRELSALYDRLAPAGPAGRDSTAQAGKQPAL